MTTVEPYTEEEFIELLPDKVNKTLPTILGIGAASRGWSGASHRGLPLGARIATVLLSAAGGAGAGYLIEKNMHNKPRKFLRVVKEPDLIKNSSVRRAVMVKISRVVRAGDLRPETYKDLDPDFGSYKDPKTFLGLISWELRAAQAAQLKADQYAFDSAQAYLERTGAESAVLPYRRPRYAYPKNIYKDYVRDIDAKFNT